MPDRELVPGVEVATRPGHLAGLRDPGHAPSHVVLHQPERGLLLSGDHLLGRVSLYYDYGYTPGPCGRVPRSLDVVDELDVQLVLAGHGRPVRDARALTRPTAARWRALERVARRSPAARARPSRSCRAARPELPLDDDRLGAVRGALLPAPPGARGEAVRVDGGDPERWESTPG